MGQSRYFVRYASYLSVQSLSLKGSDNNEQIVQILVFWVATPCGLVDRYQHFEGVCFLLQGGSIFLRDVRTLLYD
jgi:hypothetical protein